MKGNITKRGANSWRLKFDAGRDADGGRKVQFITVRGSKRAAQIKLASLITAVGGGGYVAPSKATVTELVRSRVDVWEAAGDVTARTARRYRQLCENQIVPHIGEKPLQKLTRLDVEAWHATLRVGGLAPRTIGLAHRLLGRVLSDAERDDLVTRNVVKLSKAPRVAGSEIAIVQDVPGFVGKLHGSRLRMPAMVALFTGMRLGEVLALRWSRIDLDRKRLEVREALDGAGFKAPKTKAGQRTVSLPDVLVDALRDYRREQLESRLQLGLGRQADDALLFARLDGGPLNLQTISSDWGTFADRIGIPEITFHALRHTHASQLIASGVDIVTISKRLGHAKPNITLAVYAHMFTSDDSKAAAAINAALPS